MDIVRQSLILQLIASFFSLAKAKYFESAFHCGLVVRVIAPALRWIDRKWDESFIMNVLRRLGGVFRRGLCCRFFTRPSAFDAAVEESRVFRALMWCANLVPNLLHRAYLRRPAIFDGSVFVRLCGHGPLFVLSLLALEMLVTPQELWNNFYSLGSAVLALLLFWVSGARRPERRLSLRHVGAWPVFFFAVTILSAFWSIDFSLSFRFVFFSLTCFIVLLVLVSLVENERELLAVAGCIAAGLFVCCVYAVVQGVIGVEPNAKITDLDANADMPGRVYSFFENSNSFANIIVLFAPLCLTLGLDGKKPARSAFLLATFLIACLALIQTYSRGGWIAIAFAMFVLLLVVKPRYAPILIALACLAFPLLPDSIVNRFLSIFMGDTSIGTRRYLYDGAFGAIAMSPVLGVGLGSAVGEAAVLSGMYTIAEDLEFIHAHNIYIEIWAESGIFALLSFIFAMFYALRRGCLAFKNEAAPPGVRRVAAGCVAGFSGSLLFGLADYPWSYPRVMVMYWLLFALLCAAAKLSENNTIKEMQ